MNKGNGMDFLRSRRRLWRRWKAGQTLHEIGRAFGKDHSSIRSLLARRGGIAPAVRRRSPPSAHLGRAGRHLARNRFRFVDS